MKKVRRTRALLHSVLAVGTLGSVTLIIVLGQTARLGASLATAPAAHIAVEHTGLLRISLAIAVGTGAEIIDLSHDGSGAIEVSMPQDWVLREVRGAAITEVPSDPPAFDFRRWHVPANATVSYLTKERTGKITMHNIGGQPLQVEWKRVDLKSGRVESDTMLVKDRTVEF